MAEQPPKVFVKRKRPAREPSVAGENDADLPDPEIMKKPTKRGRKAMVEKSLPLNDP